MTNALESERFGENEIREKYLHQIHYIRDSIASLEKVENVSDEEIKKVSLTVEEVYTILLKLQKRAERQAINPSETTR